MVELYGMLYDFHVVNYWALKIFPMIGNDPERRDMLLKETPEIETKRKALDAKVAGLESAIATLNTLAMRQ